MRLFTVAIVLTLTLASTQLTAHDYMGMEPVIIDAKLLEGVTNEDGETIKILLGTEETAGQYTLFSDSFADKTEVGLHKHDWHDEAFYVIKGSFEVINGDENEKHVVTADSVVFTPRGTKHYWKALEPDSKFLVIYTPGGWEHFFEAVTNLTPEQLEDKEFMEEFMISYDEHLFQ